MKRQLTLISLALFCIYNLAKSQQSNCGFTKIHSELLNADPTFRARISETEIKIKEYVQSNKKRIAARVMGTSSTLYTIPVVFHIVHTGGVVGSIYNPSDSIIQATLNFLNNVYNGTHPGTIGAGDIQIQFALAVRDPNCNPTSGIERVDASSNTAYVANGVNVNSTGGVDQLAVKDLSRWSPSDYYNIWVVNKIDAADGTSGTFIGGFATFPGSSQRYDGTIMLATQLGTGKKTLPHEIGHAFGLYHLFDDNDPSVCPNNADCSSQGDYVCDTDPITQPSLFACRTGNNNPCTGTTYTVNTEENYMNYTNCANLFTSGQKTRMLAFAASIYRYNLSTSAALQTVNIKYPYTNPSSASCVPATSATGLSANYAGILNVYIGGKNFQSNPAATDGGYLNGTTNCIRLVSLTKGNTYSLYFNVWQQNFHQLRAWIDFNNDGVFDNVTEQIHYNSFFGSAQGFATSGSFIVPNTVTVNTVLRMRVVEDLVVGYPNTVDITSACHNPYYGQVEDYPVYVADAIVLPMNLLTFSGQLQNKSVVLNWTTSNEVNTQKFDIEKSIDGVNFYSVGAVEATGNGKQKEMYGFTDDYLGEINYYRLRIFDVTGQFTISKTIIVKNESPAKDFWVANPFNNSISLQLTKKPEHLQLILMDINGSIISLKYLHGVSEVKWEVPNSISPGVYILKAIVDGEIITKKLIKQ